MLSIRSLMICLIAVALLPTLGCAKSEEPTTPPPGSQQPSPSPTPASTDKPTADPYAGPMEYGQPRTTLLLTQAQFDYVVDEKTGKSTPKPGPARLVILRQFGDQWRREVVEDPESNVFHKATFFNDPDNEVQRGIITVGAQAAAIKFWQHADEKWSAETLWKTTFGGTFDRLRDYEIADVTGDGQVDIPIATHDQGVVAVLIREGAGWQVKEIDRYDKRTFVHEIEVTDLDGDGVNEIYATPSEPNRLDGTPQPGSITCYRQADDFKRTAVEEFTHRHAKEIMATDLGDGPVLLAALEGEEGHRPDQPPDADKTAIKQYRYQAGKYVGEIVATLPDTMCRFLNTGDVDGDGKPELIASTRVSGIWMLKPGESPWNTKLIDRNSGGFEHATVLADADGDGTLEIYVVADEQKRVRRYHWDGKKFVRQNIYSIGDDKFTFNIFVGKY